MSASDEKYLKIITEALAVCADYRPKFGQGRQGGLSLEQFQKLYESDPFYSWFGLNSPLMYAAHKAAGGMTSVYRQIGIGCQWVFVEILKDQLSSQIDEDIAERYERARWLLLRGTVNGTSLDSTSRFLSASALRAGDFGLCGLTRPARGCPPGWHC